MNLKQLIDGFCAAQGLPALAPDGEGRYRLTADQYAGYCFNRGDSVYVQAELAPLPEDRYRRETLIARLLTISWAQRQVMYETLSIDDQSGSLSLHRQLAGNELTPAAFAAALARFFDTIEYLSSEV